MVAPRREERSKEAKELSDVDENQLAKKRMHASDKGVHSRVDEVGQALS